jgi:hypothetical protein
MEIMSKITNLIFITFYRKEALVKKAMKCKELEEDNKKLRKLLKYCFR